MHLNDPDHSTIFNGFVPIWPLVLLGIAILFAFIFLLGLVCHLFHSRKSNKSNRFSTNYSPPLWNPNSIPIVSVASNNLESVHKTEMIF